MIDPITAMSVAVNAFGTIKRMVSAGKEVEDTLSQIGRFYGAVSDLSEHRRRSDNPPLFKKIIAAKSVNEEAMETYAENQAYTADGTGTQGTVDVPVWQGWLSGTR